MKIRNISILFLSLLLTTHLTYSQSLERSSTDLSNWIDKQFTNALDSLNIAGATFVLMKGDSIMHMNGYGLADIDTKTPVSANTSLFEIGSVSKTFVATAIMQLYEEGKLDLDTDVNTYLKSFQLEHKYEDPITIKHILTHTAGFDQRSIDVETKNADEVIPLAEYLKKRMPPQIRPVGKVLTYSNHGYCLLGLIVEEITGVLFYEYVQNMILKPLEMNRSGFKKRDQFKEDYATCYLQKDGELIPYDPRFAHRYPSGSLTSTASDMSNYISMFLNNGSYKGVKILDSLTVAKMHETAFKQYEKAQNGWTLGFYERRWNDVRLVIHGGLTRGFSSDLILIPDQNIGFFISFNSYNRANRVTSQFNNNFRNDLLSRLLPTYADTDSPKDDQMGSVEEPLELFTGKYRLTRYGFKTIAKLSVFIGGAPEIDVTLKDNKLEIPEFAGELVPSSDLTFHSQKRGYVAFGRDESGDISYFLTDTIAFHKLKWYENSKFLMYWAGSITAILFLYIITAILRKLFFRKKKSHAIKKINFILSSSTVVFLIVLGVALQSIDPNYGIPFFLKIMLLMPFFIILLLVAALNAWIKAIRSKELKTVDLIYQTITVIAALLLIPWLMYFNLIGFNY